MPAAFGFIAIILHWIARSLTETGVSDRIFVSILVFVCCILAITLLTQQRSPNPSADKTNDSQGNGNDNPAFAEAPIDHIDHNNNRRPRAHDTERPNKYERRIARWTVVVGFFTGLLSIATGISAYFLYATDEAIHGQLIEMKNQRLLTIAQLRANIRREVPAINAFGEGGKPIGIGQKIMGWSVSPRFVNVGATNARDYRGWFDLRSFKVTPGQSVSGKDCPDFVPPDALPDSIVIVQGGSISQVAKNITTQDLIDARDGISYILIWGQIEYRDMFPDTPIHHEDWCIALLPNDIERMIISPFTLRESID